MAQETTHDELAERLAQRLLSAGMIDADLRNGAMEAGGGNGERLTPPYDVLARTIGAASYRVTDAQVAAVRDALGSDKATFEVVMSASVGAGLRRWNAARRAIREAADATR